MKRLFCALLVTLTTVGLSFAQNKVRLTDQELDYAELVVTIQKIGSPYLKGDYVIFTLKNDARHVGIAVDFEDFRQVHSFKVKRFFDEEYNEDGSLCFYIMKLPKNVLQVNYRLVIDGLWTLDPMNSETVFDERTGLTLSHFDATRNIPVVTEQRTGGNVRFIHKDKAGQVIRLGGNFTGWDSWIYTMSETAPGIYEIELPLPPGRYEYAFYNGMTSFPDEGNPKKCYTGDGKVASLLLVE